MKVFSSQWWNQGLKVDGGVRKGGMVQWEGHLLLGLTSSFSYAGPHCGCCAVVASKDTMHVFTAHKLLRWESVDSTILLGSTLMV